MSDFKVGDVVIIKSKNYSGVVGIIKFCTTSCGISYFGIRDPKFNVFGNMIFFEKNEIMIVDPEYLKEKEKRKEELRLKHINIDPFGEEDWEE